MPSVVVQEEIVIGRPAAIVKKQFFDFEHHVATKVHRDLGIVDLRRENGGVRFSGRRKVFGQTQEDDIEVRQKDDGTVTLTSVAGSNAGLVITQTFEEIGADKTRVRVHVDFPVSGLLAMLKPLVRAGLRRDTRSALEEDRFDLEERGYALRPGDNPE